jgi:diguanylate cyclase (GGDEF)-like protein
LIPLSPRPASTAAALAAVRRLSFTTLDAPDARAIYGTLAAELLAVFAVDRVHVCRVSSDGSFGRGTAFAAAGGDLKAEAEYVLPFDGPSGVCHVIQTGKPLHVVDAPASPLVSRQLVEHFGAASVLFVPLAFEGSVRAVTLLLSHSPREFAEKEIELAYTMANQASAGLAVLEMRSGLGRRAERQAALARAAAALNARLDLRAVLDTLCREADHALGGDVACFYLGDDEDRGLAIAGHGIPEDSDWWGSTIEPGEGIGGRVLGTGEPAVSSDYRRELPASESPVRQKLETAVGVPVRWDGALKGALAVGFQTMRAVANEDIQTLKAIADLAAVACSNAEAFEQAQAAARTDSLTGFLNHGAIQVRIREEIWRARRSGAALTCLLADLDNFKPINDRHGHLVGDEILKRVAAAISSEFRAYDGLARYGGDEFVVVLPSTTAEDAASAAQRLASAIAETGRAFGDLGVTLTASVGIAEWREPLTAGELLDRADRALLLAKRGGRDGIVVATPETERELAELEQDGGPSDLMARFWNMISRCEKPRHVLYTLPAFLRRELELEEVALFEPGSGASGRSLVRLTAARTPGDPAPPAFGSATLTMVDGTLRRLAGGPISRGTLPELRRALEVAPGGDGGPPGSYAAIGLVRGESVQGLLLLRHTAPEFPRSLLRLAEVMAGQAMTVLLGQSGDGSRTAVAALAAAIDARDNYTLEHSEEVVGLACEVARRLGLHPTEVSKVRDGAMLHDVGKVAIPNEILYKPGPLDDSEWEVMRQHPVIGERILLRTPELTPIAPLVRHEHERWDGKGYPDGLAGETIPIGSRIIFACDAYNAMITRRPYREPMSHESALGELERGAGSQFDPGVVAALLQVLALREPVASGE